MGRRLWVVNYRLHEFAYRPPPPTNHQLPTNTMSKQVKGLIQKELTERFKDVDAAAVINPRGIAATRTNQIRRKLRENGLRMSVVKNTLAKRAVESSKLKGFESLLDGPSAIIFGQASVSTIARLLLEEKKTNDKLELRGMFFDGEVYIGEDGVTQVSKMPTREEAIGQLVAIVLSPGKNLAGALKGPGGKLASILKTIEDRAEKAAPVSEAAVAEPPVADAAAVTA